MLMYLYQFQEAMVSLEGDQSKAFPNEKEDMFSELEVCGSGSRIGTHYAGLYGYTDDMVLLTPSFNGPERMA